MFIAFNPPQLPYICLIFPKPQQHQLKLVCKLHVLCMLLTLVWSWPLFQLLMSSSIMWVFHLPFPSCPNIDVELSLFTLQSASLHPGSGQSVWSWHICFPICAICNTPCPRRCHMLNDPEWGLLRNKSPGVDSPTLPSPSRAPLYTNTSAKRTQWRGEVCWVQTLHTECLSLE